MNTKENPDYVRRHHPLCGCGAHFRLLGPQERQDEFMRYSDAEPVPPKIPLPDDLGPCGLWKGPRTPPTKGSTWCWYDPAIKMTRCITVARYAYLFEFGEDALGQDAWKPLRHLCGHALCCNPWHHEIHPRYAE